MVTTLVTAVILGLAAGMAPGPYTTMVVGTGFERGFRPAARLALAPLVTDILPLVVTALVLERLSPTVLMFLGMMGGVVIAMIGVRFLTRHAAPLQDEVHLTDQSARFGHVVLSSLLSPAPWLFWLIVGSPLLLAAWGRSPVQGVVYIVALFATNIGSATALAWGASHGSTFLEPRWKRRLLRVVGGVLVAAGSVLVWQALSGDFQELVDRQRAFRSAVEEGTVDGGAGAEPPEEGGRDPDEGSGR